MVKHRHSKLACREAIHGYLCISPWLLGFIIFLIGPIIASIVLSLYDWDLLTSPHFIGMANYQQIFAQDLDFRQALKVTSIYAGAAIPLGLVAGVLLALIMNQKLKGIHYFRTLYFLPAAISGVAVAILWKWMFDPDFGLINRVLFLFFRIQGPMWLYSEKWALPSFVIMSLWGVGGSMMIYLAGLQGIPRELYEAAEIDGANSLSKLLRITLPMLSPVIFFNLVMGIIGSFQIFTQAHVMTNGGPHNATLFYVLYLYRNAFEYMRMGYASALAWVLFVVILALTLVAFTFARYWVHYEGQVK